ncbi:hypothetical protein [Bradyrhizobium sp. UFLA05-112]
MASWKRPAVIAGLTGQRDVDEAFGVAFSLGQPAEWRDFRSWLDGNEPTKVAVTGTSLIAQSKQLYEAWSKQYGVRNSFYRFTDEVLPPDALQRLLAGIEYLILSNPPTITQQNGDDDKKKRWLFEVRNRFTHGAQVNKGFHPERFGPTPLARQSKQYRFGPHSWEVIFVEVGQGVSLKLFGAALPLRLGDIQPTPLTYLAPGHQICIQALDPPRFCRSSGEAPYSLQEI